MSTERLGSAAVLEKPQSTEDTASPADFGEVVYRGNTGREITRGDIQRNGARLASLIDEFGNIFVRGSRINVWENTGYISSEDLLQETYLRVLINGNNIFPDGIESPQNRVLNVMRSVHIDMRRRMTAGIRDSRKHSSWDSLVEEQGESYRSESFQHVENTVVDMISADEQLHAFEEKLQKAYPKKSDTYRRIFHLIVSGYTRSEISKIMNIPEGTIKKQIHAIKETLRTEESE